MKKRIFAAGVVLCSIGLVASAAAGDAEFVGSETCKKCHKAEYES